MANKHELWELQSMQVAPLNAKIAMTKQRIRDCVNEFGVDGVYVSFSGGKDSTVLLTIAREMYPDIKAVFVDTGLEYPEIREFVKTWDNVDWLKPKMNFKQVIEKYGYPFISKEVSEAVWGARKYLTHLIDQGMLDRPTDRPHHKWHYQKYRQICGIGEYSKNKKQNPEEAVRKRLQKNDKQSSCSATNGNKQSERYRSSAVEGDYP